MHCIYCALPDNRYLIAAEGEQQEGVVVIV